MTPAAIGTSDLTKIGIGTTAALVVIGIILALVLTALIARVLIAVVVIVLAVVVWQQRGAIEHKIDQRACPPSLSFFGLHVDAPHTYKHFCRTHRKA
jgi:hypothetical protein